MQKTVLNNPDNHNGMVTHLEADNLESKVKRTLGSIIMNKVSEGDGIPAELFQIQQDDTDTVLPSVRQQVELSASWKN